MGHLSHARSRLFRELVVLGVLVGCGWPAKSFSVLLLDAISAPISQGAAAVQSSSKHSALSSRCSGEYCVALFAQFNIILVPDTQGINHRYSMTRERERPNVGPREHGLGVGLTAGAGRHARMVYVRSCMDVHADVCCMHVGRMHLPPSHLTRLRYRYLGLKYCPAGV